MWAKKLETPKISDTMMEIASNLSKAKNDIIMQWLHVSWLELKWKTIFLKWTTVPVFLRTKNYKIWTDSLEIYQFFMDDSDKVAFTFWSIMELNLKESKFTISWLKYEEILALNKEKKLGLNL